MSVTAIFREYREAAHSAVTLELLIHDSMINGYQEK